VSYGSSSYQRKISSFFHTTNAFLTLKFSVYVLKIKVIDANVIIGFVSKVLNGIIKRYVEG